MEWFVRLNGHEDDLGDLSAQFHSADPCVYQDGNAYYLKSSEFLSMTDDNQVYGRARDLIRRINGAANVHIPGFRSVGVNCVISIDAGNRKAYVYLEGHIEPRGHVALKIYGDASSQVDMKPVQNTTTISEKDKNVADALRFFSGDPDWFDLYKIYEIVKDDVRGPKQISQRNWAAEKDIDRFTDAANNQEVTGEKARHARFTRGRGAKKLSLMSLDEAKSLWASILRKWIESKRP